MIAAGTEWRLSPLGETSQMDIRELTGADREAATHLWGAAGLTRPWNEPADDFDRAVGGPTSTILGALDGGELVATVMAGHDGHRGWVYYLAVEPGSRRRGLGRRLMEEAEHWLREHGVAKLNLMVRGSNPAALAFYQQLGYEPADVTVFARWLVAPRSP
jgi:ribosomal protein S18 acetylase RimI-like enzyme